MESENQMDSGRGRGAAASRSMRIPRHSPKSLRSGVSQSMMNNPGQFQSNPGIAGTVGPRIPPQRKYPNRGPQFQRFMQHAPAPPPPPHFNRGMAGGMNPGHHFGHGGMVGGGVGRPMGPGPGQPHQFPGMGGGGPIISPRVPQNGGHGMLGHGGGSVQDLVQQMMQDLQGGVNQHQFDNMQGGYNPGAMQGDFKRAGVAGNPMNMLVQYLTQTMSADGQGTGQYTMDPTKIGMIQQLLQHATRQAQNRPRMPMYGGNGGGGQFIAGA